MRRSCRSSSTAPGRRSAAGAFGLPRIRLVVGEPIAVEAAKPTIAGAKALTAQLQAAVESLRGGGIRRATPADARAVADVFIARGPA